MKEDKIYKLLKEKMYTVSSLPPQEIGSLTPYWKKFASFVKHKPIKTVMFGASVSSLILWFLLGTALIQLVSILQYGF